MKDDHSSSVQSAIDEISGSIDDSVQILSNDTYPNITHGNDEKGDDSEDFVDETTDEITNPSIPNPFR